MGGLLLPPEEQRRILGEIDLALEARAQTGPPDGEPAALTLLWNIIGELRAFCQFLGAASDVEQLIAMEREAIRQKVTTPTVLIFTLYRALRADPDHRPVIAPKWLDDVLREIDEESRTDPEPGERVHPTA